MLQHQRQRYMGATSHPFVLSALALLLLNDWVFKQTDPSWITGKLSDVAWLVIMPVAVAAVLAYLRFPVRWIRVVALSAVVLGFTLLQLYPPLGAAIANMMGGTHTPDPTDLLALPAVLLAINCWRRKRRVVPIMLPILLGASIASGIQDWDRRYPCDEAELWDPHVPLFLHFAHQGEMPTRSPALRRAIRLFTDSGEEVETFIASTGSNGDVVICPKGGLKAGAVYHWQVDQPTSTSNNTWPLDDDLLGRFHLSGLRTFTTDTRSDNQPIETMTACRGVKSNVYAELRCEDEKGYWPQDTGDTGQ